MPPFPLHHLDYSAAYFSLNRTSGQDLDSPSVEQKFDSWGEWTPWTRCSRECESGRQSRMRACLFENKAKINCSGDRVQIQDCNTHKCPSKSDSI